LIIESSSDLTTVCALIKEWEANTDVYIRLCKNIALSNDGYCSVFCFCNLLLLEKMSCE
jgi:hypothetical protein